MHEKLTGLVSGPAGESAKDGNVELIISLSIKKLSNNRVYN